MVDTLYHVLQLYRETGSMTLVRRAIEYGLRKLYLGVVGDPRRMYRDSTSAFLRYHDVNVCYNQHAIDQYDESMTNVLIATESPAVVEHLGWIDPNLSFDAEISFADFYGLNHYYCPRRLYAGRDSFVQLDRERQYTDKSGLISHIYSDKTELPGHRLRHGVSSVTGDGVDEFGSGAGEYVEEKVDTLAPYRFQIVIENGQYPEYVSEKFFDCLKTMTIPVYRGGQTAVEKMGFDTDAVFFFDTLDELRDIVETNVTAEAYDRLRPAVEHNRERLIEIRNQLKFEQYLEDVRIDFLTTRRHGEIDIHLEME